MFCTAARDYAKFISTILKDFIKLIDLNHFVTSSTIRELLQIVLPIRKYRSSDDIVDSRFNAKLFIK